jgi:hypothetical protein
MADLNSHFWQSILSKSESMKAIVSRNAHYVGLAANQRNNRFCWLLASIVQNLEIPYACGDRRVFAKGMSPNQSRIVFHDDD